MMRSMVFSILCSALTYLIISSLTPTLYKVNLTDFLQERAKSLAQSGMPPEKIHLKMLKIKEDLSKKLTHLAHKKKGIILTSGVFGNVQDITKELGL